MTVSSIEAAKDLVDEMQGQGVAVGSVWVYTHTLNKNKLFAVFTLDQLCDIHETYYVDKPVRIWIKGRWLGEYEYVNDIE